MTLLLLVLLLLLLLLLITFMQGIYTYIPVPNHVPRDCSVAGILLLLFMVHVMLFPMLNLLYCTFPYHVTSFISSFSKPFFVLPLYIQSYFGLDDFVSDWVHSELPRCSSLLSFPLLLMFPFLVSKNSCVVLLLLYSLCCWPLGLSLSTLINKNWCIIILST
jgi:hypothetical protein